MSKETILLSATLAVVLGAGIFLRRGLKDATDILEARLAKLTPAA